jgi:hypothetical protein
MAVPATIWFARRVMLQKANTAAPSPPMIMAKSRPRNGCPVK